MHELNAGCKYIHVHLKKLLRLKLPTPLKLGTKDEPCQIFSLKCFVMFLYFVIIVIILNLLSSGLALPHTDPEDRSFETGTTNNNNNKFY